MNMLSKIKLSLILNLVLISIGFASAFSFADEDSLAALENLSPKVMSHSEISKLAPSKQIEQYLKLKNASFRDSLSFSDSSESLLLPTDSLNYAAYDSLYNFLDSIKQEQGVQRFSQRLFKKVPANLFSSVTNAVDGNYPLKAGDQLALSVWGEHEKEYPLRLNNQGRVFLSGVGSISLNGQTLIQAETLLKQKLSTIHSGISSGKTQVVLRLEKLSPLKVFVLGEIHNPGGYVFQGNTSIFQALYQAGGPTPIGSVRNIQVNRNNKTLTIDLYDYLMKGLRPENSILNDGDVVFIPRAEKLVEITGDIGRDSTIFELKAGEGVKELLQFASGINPSAAKQNIRLRRVFEDGRMDFMDIETPHFYLEDQGKFELLDGDALLVVKSVEKSLINVSIRGAIKYPGTYQFKEGLDATTLVANAGGPLEEAYLGRIHIIRPSHEGPVQLLSQGFSDNSQNVALMPMDTVLVFSKKEMYLPDSVSISGAVRLPGRYLYVDGMTAKDLVLLGGGFLPQRDLGKVRLERLESGKSTVDVKTYSMSDDYKVGEKELTLKPYDHIEIPHDPNFYRPEQVKLSGAFLRPGVYTLAYEDEPLSSIIERAGGFREGAYLEGARFFRFADSIGQIGINLESAIKKKGRFNIPLMEGDSLFVPKKKASILVYGEVVFPTNVLYKKGENAEYYIRKAGGYTRLSDDEHIVIRYANGESSAMENADREPDPGTEIFIPARPEPKPTNWPPIVSAIAGVITAIGTITTTIIVLQSR
jgi:protein involved in polysaccharide export with SLBB domain